MRPPLEIGKSYQFHLSRRSFSVWGELIALPDDKVDGFYVVEDLTGVYYINPDDVAVVKGMTACTCGLDQAGGE